MTYPRDLRGYGRSTPHARWPDGARLALQFVLNHEEGAENCVLDGDPCSETFLSEIIGAAAFPMRHMSMESLFEYGSRAGLWRVLRAFEQRRLPLTIFGVARALERHPEAVAAYRELGHEIAAHGLRWISYQQVDEATERAHLAEAVAILQQLTGAAPLGSRSSRAVYRPAYTGLSMKVLRLTRLNLVSWPLSDTVSRADPNFQSTGNVRLASTGIWRVK